MRTYGPERGFTRANRPGLGWLIGWVLKRLGREVVNIKAYNISAERLAVRLRQKADEIEAKYGAQATQSDEELLRFLMGKG